MRLLTLNLRHGGGRRASELLRYLLGQRADVLVLSEFRANPPGAMLRAELAAAGFTHQVATARQPRINHLLIASRYPLRREYPAPLRVDRLRLCTVRVAAPEGGLSLVAAHLPNFDAKQPHWDALLHLAAEQPRTPRLLLGDFNTGLRGQDAEDGPFPFFGAGHMQRLLELGWVDAWRQVHPQGREYTWYSHRQRGFRLDHAFLSPALSPRLRTAALDHTPRLSGASDHSALCVELGNPRATTLQR